MPAPVFAGHQARESCKPLARRNFLTGMFMPKLVNTSEPFTTLQNRFANALREGKNDSLFSGIEERRMAVYQSLFFNNIHGLLSKAFPVVRKILGEDAWKQTVREFYSSHRCQTPLFPRVGGEFVSWLASIKPQELPYPFIAELAHYEYMEVLVDTADCLVSRQRYADDIGSLLEKPGQVLKTNPSATLLQYHYPVHKLSPDFLPEQALDTPVNLLVYRRHDHRTCFMQLNMANAVVLSKLESNPASFQALCDELSSSGVEDEQVFLSLKTQLIEFVEKEVLFLATNEAG